MRLIVTLKRCGIRTFVINSGSNVALVVIGYEAAHEHYLKWPILACAVLLSAYGAFLASHALARAYASEDRALDLNDIQLRNCAGRTSASYVNDPPTAPSIESSSQPVSTLTKVGATKVSGAEPNYIGDTYSDGCYDTAIIRIFDRHCAMLEIESMTLRGDILLFSILKADGISGAHFVASHAQERLVLEQLAARSGIQLSKVD